MNVESAQILRSVGPEKVNSAAETGLNVNNLTKLVLKIMYVRGVDTALELSDNIKLHIAITKELLERAKDQSLVEILGSNSREGYTDFRYGLTGKGREWAVDALQQSQYIGPAPVTLVDYRRQVLKQSVMNEHVQRETLLEKFSDLILPDTLERRLGPAVNSGRSLLLYGAPGNGKTSIAEAIGKTFAGAIKIPYCVEVDGEILKVFDPVFHHEIAEDEDPDDRDASAEVQRAEYTDRRWVVCRRPVIVVGGELRIEMLDLFFSPTARFYEAPLQMKANGGTFLVDDLGRAFVTPTELLNRWIVPMEKGIDYLALQSGSTFSVPFDNLLIFSTNLEPADLMDAAFLRRIPYKVEITYPSDEDYRKVFEMVCRNADLALSEEVVSFAMREIQSTHQQPLAFYQPKFIVDQVISAGRYRGQVPELTLEFVDEAVKNISARTSKPVAV